MKRYTKPQFGKSGFRQIIHVQAKETEPCWVKVGFLVEKTGWDNRQLRRARKQQIVAFQKREDGSMWYDLASLNSLFIIK